MWHAETSLALLGKRLHSGWAIWAKKGGTAATQHTENAAYSAIVGVEINPNTGENPYKSKLKLCGKFPHNFFTFSCFYEWFRSFFLGQRVSELF